MDDNLKKPELSLQIIDGTLKELIEDVKLLKSDVSYIKNNIKRFLKSNEEKEIVEIQTQQEGWWIWK